jgi:hypothetical protein
VDALLISWAISAAVLLVLAAFIGWKITGWVTGLLIDTRGRYSLTHLQLALWTILILSLISGVFFGRLEHGVSHPLDFTIPPEVLGLLGISAGSAVITTATKAQMNTVRSTSIAASGVGPWRPSLLQIFEQEEGTYADKVIDITKFQGFTITIVLVVAYAALAIDSIHAAKTAAGFTSLPKLAGTFLVLLAISQGTYVLGKFPAQAGTPAGLTVAGLQQFQREFPSPWQRKLARRLWPNDATIWSASEPVIRASSLHPLIVTDDRSFILHYGFGTPTWERVTQTTATPAGGATYGVTIDSAQLTGNQVLNFQFRYLTEKGSLSTNGTHTVELSEV